VIFAVTIDDPKVGATPVFHDVHGSAHIDNAAAIGSDLRIVGVLKAKDILRDKNVGLGGSKHAGQSQCQESQDLMLVHTCFLPFLSKFVLLDECGFSGWCLQVRQVSINGLAIHFLSKSDLHWKSCLNQPDAHFFRPYNVT
jgi:hypothetical protein